jgi:endonuclease/exonuclease/phosphatase family metal-dependent hydrolase
MAPKALFAICQLTAILLLSSSLASADALSIGTWNIHGGQKPNEIRNEISRTRLGQSTFLHLQEAPSDEPNDFAGLLGAEYGYFVHSVGFDSILSKYPFTETGELLINPQTGRKSAWAEVVLPNGQAIRLYSQHLSYCWMATFWPHKGARY